MSTTFTVGETVIHPHHGAAVVNDLEQRRFGDEDIEYVVLHAPFDDLTVKVPVSRIEEIGIRPCMSQETLDEVVTTLGEDPAAVDGHWSRRLKRNQNRMRSGEPIEVASVLRDLTAKLHDEGLSPAEHRLRRNAVRMLTGELAAVVDGGEVGATELVAEALDVDEIEI